MMGMVVDKLKLGRLCNTLFNIWHGFLIIALLYNKFIRLSLGLPPVDILTLITFHTLVCLFAHDSIRQFYLLTQFYVLCLNTF